MSLLMHTLHVELGERSYPVYIGRDLLTDPHLLSQHIAGSQVVIVSNDTVAPLYVERVRAVLGPRKLVTEVVLPEPEIAESGFSPDGAEVALFPDAVRPTSALADSDPGSTAPSGDKAEASKVPGIAVGLGVAAAVFGIAVFAFGRRPKNTESFASPPASGGSDFRG